MNNKFDLAEEFENILKLSSKDSRVNDLEKVADYLADAAMLLEESKMSEEANEIMDILRRVGTKNKDENVLYVDDDSFEDEE